MAKFLPTGSDIDTSLEVSEEHFAQLEQILGVALTDAFRDAVLVACQFYTGSARGRVAWPRIDHARKDVRKIEKAIADSADTLTGLISVPLPSTIGGDEEKRARQLMLRSLKWHLEDLLLPSPVGAPKTSLPSSSFTQARDFLWAEVQTAGDTLSKLSAALKSIGDSLASADRGAEPTGRDDWADHLLDALETLGIKATQTSGTNRPSKFTRLLRAVRDLLPDGVRFPGPLDDLARGAVERRRDQGVGD